MNRYNFDNCINFDVCMVTDVNVFRIFPYTNPLQGKNKIGLIHISPFPFGIGKLGPKLPYLDKFGPEKKVMGKLSLRKKVLIKLSPENKMLGCSFHFFNNI